MHPPSQRTLTSDDKLLFAINLLGLLWTGLDAAMNWGPWSAYACVAFTSLLYLAHVTWRGQSILKKLLLFGITAGLTELAADWWLVSKTQTLTYNPWGPFLIDSPSYMPLSWAGILLSMGYLGWLVERRHGLIAGLIAATVVTGLYVPFFEGLAHYADWWKYSGCPSLGVVPWYIIIGEALIGLSLTPLVTRVIDKNGYLVCLLMGIVSGLSIWVAYAIGVALT